MTLDDDYNIPEIHAGCGYDCTEKGDLEIGEVRVENGRALIRGNLRFMSFILTIQMRAVYIALKDRFHLRKI